MSTRRITAHAPLSTLVHALARVAWGPLTGAANRPARIILEVLAGQSRHCALDASGELVITAKQVADWSGYSERHIRRWLPILEGIGLIVWKRGHIQDGKPVPGLMRVNKNVIAQWVRDYTAPHDSRLEERKAQTIQRLKGLRLLRIPPVTPRWKAHADMMSALPPSMRGVQGDAVPRPLPTAGDSTPVKKNQRAKTKEMNTMPFHDFMPESCIHRYDGKGDPWRCNACRFNAMRDEQAALNAARRARAEAAKQAEEEANARRHRWQQYMDSHYPHLTNAQRAKLMAHREDATAVAILEGAA